MTRQANSKGKVAKAPPVVHKYNQTIGGVDLGDQLISQLFFNLCVFKVFL
jgi:hypothetical protein